MIMEASDFDKKVFDLVVDPTKEIYILNSVGKKDKNGGFLICAKPILSGISADLKKKIADLERNDDFCALISELELVTAAYLALLKLKEHFDDAAVMRTRVSSLRKKCAEMLGIEIRFKAVC